jgi:hypothetical protein
MSSACTVSPASSPMDGTNAATSTVSLTTTARLSALPPDTFRFAPPLPRQVLPIFTAWLLVVLMLHKAKRTERARRLLSAAAVLVLLALCDSCGSGMGSSPPPTEGTRAGAYTITVTGTSGSLSHSASFELVVK